MAAIFKTGKFHVKYCGSSAPLSHGIFTYANNWPKSCWPLPTRNGLSGCLSGQAVSLILKLPPGTLWVFGIVLIIHFLFCWETQWIWDFIKYPHRKQLDCTLPYLSQGWAQSLTGGSASHSLSTDDSLSEIFPVTPSPAPGMLPSASQLWAQSHGSKNYEHWPRSPVFSGRPNKRKTIYFISCVFSVCSGWSCLEPG